MSNDDLFWAADEDPRRPRVWIADDSPMEAQIIRRSLVDRYDVEVFGDGSSVLERLANTRRQPDVLLLDWVMPGISGEEVCRFLRARPDTADLPIVVVTASRIEVDDIVAGLSAGANDYVAKPFAPEELRARLEALLRGKQLREAAQIQTRRLQLIAHVARRLAAAGPAIQPVTDALAETLTETLGDGCLIGTGLQEGKDAAGGPGEASLSICHRDPETHARLQGLLARWTEPECDWGRLGDTVAATDPPRVIHVEGGDALRAFAPPRFHAYLAQFGVREVLLAPLRNRACSRGAVVLWRGADRVPFTRGDRALLDTCLEYGSLAFQNACLFEAERQARARVANAARERQQVAHFQEQFMGILGHDLRNPLSAISLTAERLERRLGPAESPALRRIMTSAERMRRMVDQLLDLTLARLGGGLVIIPRPVELGALTRGVIDEIQIAYPESALQARIDPDINGEWDPDRLEQAISNVACNAVQHGRAGCPVLISLLREGGEAVLEIHNQNEPGQEIPADLLPVLFDPFRRGRNEQRRSQGLGLGLFITREIVQAHGGRIGVESSRETGTTFRICLPLLRQTSPGPAR